MENRERKSFKRLIGSDLVVCSIYSLEKGRIKGLLDLTFRNSCPGKAKNRFKVLDAKAHSALCSA